MPDPTLAVVGVSLVGGMMANDAKQDAAEEAEAKLSEAERSALLLKKTLFNENENTQSPYASVGSPSVSAMADLSGANGEAARLAAEKGVASGGLAKGINTAISGAVTGSEGALGNRGGTLGSSVISKLSPFILKNLSDTQYSRLGGLASAGQAATLGIGSDSVTNQAAGLASAISANERDMLNQNISYNNTMGNVNTGLNAFDSLYTALTKPQSAADRNMDATIAANPNLF